MESRSASASGAGGSFGFRPWRYQYHCVDDDALIGVRSMKATEAKFLEFLGSDSDA